MGFKDKVVLVTGSSRGMGAALAKAITAQGGLVVINAASSIETGTALAASLPGAIFIQADCSDPDQCKQLVAKTISHYNRLDHLVLNHGINKVVDHKDLDSLDDEFIQKVFQVNTMALLYLTKAAMPHLKRAQAEYGDASILVNSSVAGLRPVGSSIAYAMTKAAANHFVKLIAKSHGPVRCNAVAPGLIETELAADLVTHLKGWVESVQPIPRIGQPDDVSEVMMSLLNLRHVTGQVVAVDGGSTLVG